MRVILTGAMLLLTACGTPNPQADRAAQIKMHCQQAGFRPGPQYGYNTQQGLITQNPGGFMQGVNSAQGQQYAERECLRSYGMWP